MVYVCPVIRSEYRMDQDQDLFESRVEWTFSSCTSKDISSRVLTRKAQLNTAVAHRYRCKLHELPKELQCQQA